MERAQVASVARDASVARVLAGRKIVQRVVDRSAQDETTDDDDAQRDDQDPADARDHGGDASAEPRSSASDISARSKSIGVRNLARSVLRPAARVAEATDGLRARARRRRAFFAADVRDVRTGAGFHVHRSSRAPRRRRPLALAPADEASMIQRIEHLFFAAVALLIDALVWTLLEDR